MPFWMVLCVAVLGVQGWDIDSASCPQCHPSDAGYRCRACVKELEDEQGLVPTFTNGSIPTNSACSCFLCTAVDELKGMFSCENCDCPSGALDLDASNQFDFERVVSSPQHLEEHPTKCTVDGFKCSFPFEYQGSIYTSCTHITPPATGGSGGASTTAGWCAVCGDGCQWCGKWAYCSSDAKTDCTASKTADTKPSQKQVEAPSTPKKIEAPAPVADAKKSEDPPRKCGQVVAIDTPKYQVTESGTAVQLPVAWCTPFDSTDKGCGQDAADTYCKHQPANGSPFVGSAPVEPSHKISVDAALDSARKKCRTDATVKCFGFSTIFCKTEACPPEQQKVPEQVPPTMTVVFPKNSQKAELLVRSKEFVASDTSGAVKVQATPEVWQVLLQTNNEISKLPNSYTLLSVTHKRYLFVKTAPPLEFSTKPEITKGSEAMFVFVLEPLPTNSSRFVLRPNGVGYVAVTATNEFVIRETVDQDTVVLVLFQFSKRSSHSTVTPPTQSAKKKSSHRVAPVDKKVPEVVEKPKPPPSEVPAVQKAPEAKITTTPPQPPTVQVNNEKQVAAVGVIPEGDRKARDVWSQQQRQQEKDEDCIERMIAEETQEEQNSVTSEVQKMTDPVAAVMLTELDKHSLIMAQLRSRQLHYPELQRRTVQYLQDIIETFIQFGSPNHPFLSRKDMIQGLLMVDKSIEFHEASMIAAISDSDGAGFIDLSEICQGVDLGLIMKRGNSTDPEDFFLPSDQIKLNEGNKGYSAIVKLYAAYGGSFGSKLPVSSFISALRGFGFNEDIAVFISNQLAGTKSTTRRSQDIIFKDFLEAALWGMLPRNQYMTPQLEAAIELFMALDKDKSGQVGPDELVEGLIAMGFDRDVSYFTSNVMKANYGDIREQSFKWFYWLIRKGVVPPMKISGDETYAVEYHNLYKNRMVRILDSYHEFTPMNRRMKQPEFMASLVAGGMRRQEARFFSRDPYYAQSSISIYQFASMISFKGVLLVATAGTEKDAAMIRDQKGLFLLRGAISSFYKYQEKSGNSDPQPSDLLPREGFAKILRDTFSWSEPESAVMLESVFRSFHVKPDGNGGYIDVPLASGSQCHNAQTHEQFRVTCSSSSNSTVTCSVPFEVCWVNILKDSGSLPCVFGQTFMRTGSAITVFNGCAAEFGLFPYQNANMYSNGLGMTMFLLAYTSGLIPPIDTEANIQNAISNNLHAIGIWNKLCGAVGLKPAANFLAPKPSDRLPSNRLQFKVNVNMMNRLLKHSGGVMTRAVLTVLIKFMRDAAVFDPNGEMDFYRFVRGKMLRLIPYVDNEFSFSNLALDVMMFTRCASAERSNFLTFPSMTQCLAELGLAQEQTEFITKTIFAPFPKEFLEHGITFGQFRATTSDKSSLLGELQMHTNDIDRIVRQFKASHPTERGIPTSRYRDYLQQLKWPLFYSEAIARALDLDNNGYISLFENWNAVRLGIRRVGFLEDDYNNSPDTVLYFMYQVVEQREQAQRNTILRRLLEQRALTEYKINVVMDVLSRTDNQVITGIQLVSLSMFSSIIRRVDSTGLPRISVYHDWQLLASSLSQYHVVDDNEDRLISKAEFQTFYAFHGITDFEIGILWGIVDMNADGQADFLEWCVAQEHGLTPPHDRSNRLALRMTWAMSMFDKFDLDSTGHLSLANIREMAPFEALRDPSSLSVSIELIVAELGVEPRVTKDIFVRMLFEGQILVRELAISPLTQWIEDVNQYYYSSQLVNNKMVRRNLIARLNRREQLTSLEANTIGDVVFPHNASHISLYQFSSAVLRQQIIIPLSKTKTDRLKVGRYYGGDDTTGTNNMDTKSSLIKNIRVSGMIRETAKFSPSLFTYEVFVPANIFQFTVTVDYGSDNPVTVNDFPVQDGVPSRYFAVNGQTPTTIYVKAEVTKTVNQVYTVLVHHENSGTATTRCTTSRGGSGGLNRLCVFPFEFPKGSGKINNDCIFDPEYDMMWCPTIPNYNEASNSDWGECKPVGSQCPAFVTSPLTNSPTGSTSNETARALLVREIQIFRELGGAENGTLDSGTFITLLVQKGQNEDQALLLADVIDTDRDNVITLREMARAIRLGLIPHVSVATSSSILSAILKLGEEFGQAGLDGIPVRQLARVISNKYKISDDLALLIATEIDFDKDSKIQNLELLRGAYMGLLPFDDNKGKFSAATKTYREFALPDGPKDAKLTKALTSSQFRSSLIRLGASDQATSLLARELTLRQSSTEQFDIPFSSFVRAYGNGIIPANSAEIQKVESILNTVRQAFVKWFGSDQEIVNREKVQEVLEKSQRWDAFQSVVLSQAITDSGRQKLDLTRFVSCYLDGLIALD